MKLLSILLVKLIFRKESSLLAEKDLYNFFKIGWIIPTNWSRIYTCATKETGEKYDFIEDTYIKLFHFQLKYCAGISCCVCVSQSI